ncbi:NAD(P)H-binding protein [Streptomyces albus]|uniref:NAD(P)H-binding protein n=1 Tax=Streptomyces albus TaxID=1888 RepID=UPI0033D99075
MRVVVLGCSTALGGLVAAALTARGDRPVALLRAATAGAHGDRLRALGAEAVLIKDGPRAAAALPAALRGADALVLAAGTGGPGTAAGRSPAARFAAAGERAGVRRYLMVSNWYGADGQPWTADEKDAYVAGKTAAEADVRTRDLDWTILRTGRLTDAPAGGGVRLARAAGPLPPPGEIGRADVAAAVVALLERPAAIGRTCELTAGPVPLDRALDDVFGTTDG